MAPPDLRFFGAGGLPCRPGDIRMGLFGQARLSLAALTALEGQIAARLRANDFDDAGQLLTGKAAKYAGAYERICGKLPERFVSVDDWDEVLADHEERARKGAPPAALHIEIAARSDGDVGLECSWRDVSAYGFSGANRETLLAELDSGAPKWADRPPTRGSALTLSNLAPLFKAIMEDSRRFPTPPREGATPDYAAYRLAIWTLYWRVHAAIKQRIDKSGLPRAIPVIVAERGLGPPSFASVYMAEARIGHEADVARILKTRRYASASDHERETDKMILDLAERRLAIRNWPADRDPERRRAAIEFARAHEALMLGALALSARRPSAEMDDMEFHQLVAAIRQARARMTPSAQIRRSA